MRLRYVLAAAVCAAGAVALGVVLFYPGSVPPPGHDEPDRPPFRAYTLVKTGGVAGVHHHIEVSSDGTVLYVDDAPIAGRLPKTSMNRLSTVLADPDLAEEGTAGAPGTTCADAFKYTLTVGDTTVSRYDCGDGARTPLLDEVIDLTAKDELRPLPEGEPRFRGLTATYRLQWENERAKVRIDADGSTRVRRNGGPPSRGELRPGTLDALRLLYDGPLSKPSASPGLECIPEQIPRYVIDPKKAPEVSVSVCGPVTDYEWRARLTIIQTLIGG